MDWQINNSVPLWALFVLLFNCVVIIQSHVEPRQIEKNFVNSTEETDAENETLAVLPLTQGIQELPPHIAMHANVTYARDQRVGVHNKQTHIHNHRFHRENDQRGAKVTYRQMEDVLKRYLRQNLEETDLMELQRQARGMFSARGKNKKLKKYIVPMIVGALLVKSLILPVIIKGLAILTSKAILLSIVSLIVASLASLKKSQHGSEKTEVQVVHVPVKHHDYKRWDDEEEFDEHYHNRRHETYKHPGPYHHPEKIPAGYR